MSSLLVQHRLPWYKEASEVPPFKPGSLSSLGPPGNSGLQGPHLSIFQYYIWPPEIILVVRWMGDTIEFDQSYKQAESKMQVTEDFTQ